MIKIMFDKAALISAIAPALCAVSDRNTLTATEGIFFETTDHGTCTLCSYDMEKGIHEEIEADIIEGGSFIVNANRLSRIIRMMPLDTVTIEVDDKYMCRIMAGNSCFELHSLPGSDFPAIPVLQGNHSFSVTQGQLRRMIAQVQFAIAQNDQRAALNGAFFEITEGRLKLVACDGNKLAIRESRCDMEQIQSADDTFHLSFIVPGKTLAELIKLMDDDDDKMTVALTRRHIIFFLEKLTFFSRLIDAEYIDYNRVIRKESPINVVMSRDAFEQSLERAALVTEDRAMGQAKSSVKCSFEDTVLHISAANLSGSVNDDIPIEKTGEDLLIGFNNKYLLEALRVCPEDNIRISLATALMSMQIEGVGNEEDDMFLYMILPVKMS
ncbi:MAG: DNA polymerase III subunit beta [Clostridiales bacterium]|nr:DNA polymerase III subunit beta [Clostridiales bacterium]